MPNSNDCGSQLWVSPEFVDFNHSHESEALREGPWTWVESSSQNDHSWISISFVISLRRETGSRRRRVFIDPLAHLVDLGFGYSGDEATPEREKGKVEP